MSADGNRADSRIEHLRVPPQSIEAEQAVLGGLMLQPLAWSEVSDMVKTADFYRRDHQLIWRAIEHCESKGKPFDAVTLGDWFESQGLLDQVQKGAYLIELASTTPSAANIRAYAEIVRDKSTLRRLIEVGTAIVNAGFNPEGRDTTEIVGKAQTDVGALLESRPTDLEETTPIMDRVYGRLLERRERGGGIDGLSTGIRDLDVILNGLKAGLYVLAARPKMGKEQPNSAQVRVPGGWKRMGELRVGDAVCSPDGAPSKVVGVYPQGVRDVYRVTFADGRVARCGIQHLWEVRHRQWGAPKVIDTRQLMVLIGNSPGRYSVRMVSGHFEPALALPVDPWLVGFLIGDGSLTCGVGFSSGDDEIVTRITNTVGDGYLIRQYGTCDFRIVTPRGKPNPLLDQLRELGLIGCKSPDKRIPQEYLHGSREQRMELLRGLVDADGWVEKYGCVQVATSSPLLASDIRSLVWSLGGKCSHRVKRSKSLPSHVLTLNLGPQQVAAWLPRKVDRLKGGRGEQQWLTVKAVAAEDLVEECTCIKVSHPSELYVTDDYVVTHNTTLAQNIAEHVAMNLKLPVDVFSFEMQPEALGERMLSSVGNIDASRLRRGELDDMDWANVTMAMRRIKAAPIRISRPKSARVEHVVAQIRRRHAKKPVGLVVIDYLQLMETSGAENRTQGVGDITRALALMAGQLGIPVLLLSQLSRKLEDRGDKRPIPSDLRDSGSIEQDADAVLFIYRDEAYHPNSRDRGTAEIIVALQRNGPSDTARVRYKPDRFRFEDLPDGWEPAPLPEKVSKPRGFKKGGNAAADRAAGGE